ncbi:MAG TPA: hypothetical protein VLW50_14835 [Streptosporangiaceae bacterium]|nr:hypothetical protein [Streptosporangiaceae bacterium]
MTDPGIDLLTALRALHPDWQIETQGPVWVAVKWPTRTELDMLYGRTLDELAEKLAETDGTPE